MLRLPVVVIALLALGCTGLDVELTCDEQGDCPADTRCLAHACVAASGAPERTRTPDALDPVVPPGAPPAIVFTNPSAPIVYVDGTVALTFSATSSEPDAEPIVITAESDVGVVTVANPATHALLDTAGATIDDTSATVTLTATDAVGRTSELTGRVEIAHELDCFRILARGFSRGDGAYRVEDDGAHALVEVTCDMTNGGFTFVAGVVAEDARWFYEGIGWTDANAFGTEHPHAGSTKASAFAFVDVDELAVDLTLEPTTAGAPAVAGRYTVSLPSAQPSTRSLFTSGARVDIDADDLRDASLAAFGATVDVQDDACGAGVNVDLATAAVRIGLVGDNDGGSCDSPNSWLGLGGGGTFFVDDTLRIAAGNRCERPDVCDLSVPAHGDVWSRARDLRDVGTFESCADATQRGWSHPNAVFSFTDGSTHACP